MKILAEQVKDLEKFIPEYHICQPAVSGGPVGWHIEHCLLTIDQIIEALKRSSPDQYRPKFNFWKNIVMVTQWIPRGKAKAPKSVRPANESSPELLKQHVDTCLCLLKNWESLQKNNHFPHPYFGSMNTKQAMKFLRIHTNHHLKIIREIMRHSA